MPFLLPNQKHQSTVETRIQIGWNNIQAFVTIAYQKDMSLIVRGRLYSSCVRSAMLHGSETWPVRKGNEVALQQAEMRMVRWMCGFYLSYKISISIFQVRVERD